MFDSQSEAAELDFHRLRVVRCRGGCIDGRNSGVSGHDLCPNFDRERVLERRSCLGNQVDSQHSGWRLREHAGTQRGGALEQEVEYLQERRALLSRVKERTEELSSRLEKRSPARET